MNTRFLLAASCMIALLSGCGEAETPTTPVPAEAPKAPPGGKAAAAPAPASTQQKPVD